MRNLDRHILVYTVGGNATTGVTHNMPLLTRDRVIRRLFR